MVVEPHPAGVYFACIAARIASATAGLPMGSAISIVSSAVIVSNAAPRLPGRLLTAQDACLMVLFGMTRLTVVFLKKPLRQATITRSLSTATKQSVRISGSTTILGNAKVQVLSTLIFSTNTSRTSRKAIAPACTIDLSPVTLAKFISPFERMSTTWSSLACDMITSYSNFLIRSARALIRPYGSFAIGNPRITYGKATVWTYECSGAPDQKIRVRGNHVTSQRRPGSRHPLKRADEFCQRY